MERLGKEGEGEEKEGGYGNWGEEFASLVLGTDAPCRGELFGGDVQGLNVCLPRASGKKCRRWQLVGRRNVMTEIEGTHAVCVHVGLLCSKHYGNVLPTK